MINTMYTVSVLFYVIFTPSSEHHLEIIGCRDPFMEVLKEIEDHNAQ